MFDRTTILPLPAPEVGPNPNELAHRKPITDRLNEVAQTAGRIAGGALLAMEMTPVLNEVTRAGIVAAVESGNNNPATGTAAWFAGTFLFEAAGAAVATHLLHSEAGARQVDRIRDKASTIGGVKTNLSTEAAVAIIAGAPLATAVKHEQDPSRSKVQDLKYGLATSVLVSAGATLNAAPIIKGANQLIEDPRVGWSLVGVGVLALAGVTEWGRHKYRTLRKCADAASTQAYRAHYDSIATGPQLEGMLSNEAQAALEDKRSLNMLLAETGERVPVLTPLEHNAEFNAAYFEKRYPGRSIYYMSSIITEVERSGKYFQDKLDKRLQLLADQGAVIVSDYRSDGGLNVADAIESALTQAGVTFTKNDFVDDRNGSQAGVTHYAGKSHINERDTISKHADVESAFMTLANEDPDKYNSQDGTMLVRADGLNEHILDEVWTMYSERFDDLISQSPAMQKQSREDFISMLKAEGTLMTVKFKDGEPVCAAYFVKDMEKAYWLNPDYYKQQFPGEEIWYFPAIAGKRNSGRQSIAVVELLIKLAAATESEPVIAFQCTNLSRDYITGPVVEKVINAFGQYSISMEQIADYRYVGYELSSLGKIE